MNPSTMPAENVLPWFRNVRPGDMLHPIPLWNNTERGLNTLPVPVEVHDVIDAQSQSGVLFSVRTNGGKYLNLDAAWFNEPVPQVTLDRVIAAIKTVRINQAGLQEFNIHDSVCAALATEGIAYRREHAFGERCRADIWVDGIVIEVKKQRPARAALLSQLQRYAEKKTVRALIAVMERSVNLPPSIYGKPVSIVSLNALWGIAL